MATVRLKIRERFWAGRGQTPPPAEYTFDLQEGATFALHFHRDQHTCAVTRIQADAVDLAPVGTAPALVADDGSFGPHAMAAPTHLAVGQSVRVGTWTLDTGATWEIINEAILP